MATKLQALIFDVDGTLTENERDGHRVAFNQAFQAAGLAWHWSVELYGELLQVAGGKERMRFYLEHYSPPVPEVKDWTAFIAELHLVKTERYGAILKSGKIGLRPGVKRLIKDAHQAGIGLAIATTTRLENVLNLLSTAVSPTAPDWFDVIAAGDTVPRKKPAPDIYCHVLDKLALPAADCLVFEDTQHGLTSAIGAGLKTVITVNTYTHDQDFSKAALVLNHLGEPRLPFEVLAGQGGGQDHFDLALAESLLQA